MSRTSINVAAVSSARNTISKASSNVVNVLNSFRSTKSNVDSKIQNRNNIGAKLNSVQNQLNSIVSEINSIANTVSSGLNLYNSTDMQVEERGRVVCASIVQAKRSAYYDMFSVRSDGNKDDKKIKKTTVFYDDLKNIIDKFLKNTSQTEIDALAKKHGVNIDSIKELLSEQGTLDVSVVSFLSEIKDSIDDDQKELLCKYIDEQEDVSEKNVSGFDNFKNELKDILIENAGLGGGFISSITTMIEATTSGTIDPGGIAKGSKKIVNSVYNILRNGEKLEKLSRMNPGQAVKTGLKRLVGFDKAFTGSLSPSVAKSFKTRFYNNFSKQIDDSLSAYTTKGAKSVFAWAGVAVSAVANGFQNYDECKSGKISAERAIAETITETAVDVGTGLLVGAAVSAGIAAIGWVSAPVIAVGAITAGVMVGTDAICKWITKSVTGEAKGLTETVSDLVLDAGEAVVKAGKKVVSNVVKGVSDAGKAVGSFFKKLF